MKITDEMKRRALATVNDPSFVEVWSFLVHRAERDVLEATTSEDRDEKWHGYRAMQAIPKTVKKWAEEARHIDRKG